MADERGVRPPSRSERLADVADPDVLDALFADPAPATALQFYFRGYRVTVTGDGDVAVNE